MGQNFGGDYWLPFRFIKKGVDVVCIKEAMFYHQTHELQYNNAEWARNDKALSMG